MISFLNYFNNPELLQSLLKITSHIFHYIVYLSICQSIDFYNFELQAFYDIHFQFNSQVEGMISREGDYYVCQGEALQQEKQERKEVVQEVFEVRGDIKDRIKLIKSRVDTLKLLKQEQNKSIKTGSWMYDYRQELKSPQDFSITLTIPDQILSLQKKVEQLQGKIVDYQVYRQRTDKRGTVVDRVKNLQKKLTDMLRAKSIQAITNSIIQYSPNLQEREEYMKQLYIYEVYTRTQGMTDELNTLQKYLSNLSAVQNKVSSSVPTATLVKSHNEILSKSKVLGGRIEKMFEVMKGEYQSVLKQIDTIDG